MIEVQPPTSAPGPLSINVPGSKSYTNRAFLLAALAKGQSTLRGALESEDTRVMIKALRALGVSITKRKSDYLIEGSGGQFKDPGMPLELENAGTAVRSLTAALATQTFRATITGNQRMQERPIGDLVQGLKPLGVDITATNSCPPVTVQGPMQGGETTINGNISSQYLSALLMAAPRARKSVSIRIQGKLTSLPYVDMTLDTMEQFGVHVQHTNHRSFTLAPQNYQATTYQVEGDASSATYPLALAALHGTSCTINNIPPSSRQADLQFLNVLKAMGCRIITTPTSIGIHGPKQLKPLGTINLNRLPDAAMTVAILSAFAPGTSKLIGIGNLRVKETDRLKALACELNKIGATVQEGKDTLTIHGDPDALHGGIIETYHDHRMAMCFAIAGSRIANVRILDPDCVQKTYPTFWKELHHWGVPCPQRKAKSNPNIILAGLRGSGKSTLGRKLAQKLNYDFIDTDDYIVQKIDTTIPGFVREKGWKAFRALEKETARELAQRTSTVISTGGGMFTNQANITNLRKNGYIILLKANPATLATRISGDHNRIRLTKAPSLEEECRELWQQRRAQYFQAADIALDTSAHKPDQVIRQILDYCSALSIFT